jgi:hypothetical protein
MSNDVVVNRLGMGMIGVADDGCNCFVMNDGGYEITDLELKQSDNISMLAILVMIIMMMIMMNESMCGCEQKIVYSDERVWCRQVRVEITSRKMKEEKKRKTIKNIIRIGVGN